MNALILADIQNDFIPGGALAVPDGDRVIAVANELMPFFRLVIASRDWHPPDHGSFASAHPGRGVGDVIELGGLEQVLWPDHCVQNTWGAEFAPGFRKDWLHHIVNKGMDRDVDAYSVFYDNARRRDTGLDDFLKERGVETLYIMGLATDYCVLYTVRDARDLGYDINVIEDGCRGINLRAGDVAAAFREMEALGATIVSSAVVT